MENNSGLVCIDGQPKQNIHFRYASEKNHNGFITKRGKLNECPQIRLSVAEADLLDAEGNKRKWYILSSLHSYREGAAKCLSPHVLEKACDGPVKYEFIFEEMQEDNEKPLDRYWVLEKYRIRRTATQQRKTSLVQKHEHYKSLNLPLDFKQLQGDVDFDKPESLTASDVLNVCLGFTIFVKDNAHDAYRLYSSTIYSDNIFDGNDMNTQLCNFKGQLNGGDYIFILGDFKAKGVFTVHLINNDIGWREVISQLEIIRKTAIKFKLPQGPIDEDIDEIEVIIRVVVGNSTYASEDMRFLYVNRDNGPNPRKRSRIENIVEGSQSHLRNSAVSGVEPDVAPEQELEFNPNDYTDEDLPENLEALLDLLKELDEESRASKNMSRGSYRIAHVSRDCVRPTDNANMTKSSSRVKIQPMDVQTKIKKIISQILTMPKNPKNSLQIISMRNCNTIFHHAIMDETTLRCLHKHMETSPHKQLVLKARNCRRQNLLHYACLKNNHGAIRPLVGMGCGLHELDWQGRTPLHIAIECQYTQCISKIQELIEDPSDYAPDFLTQLIKMFKVYDDKGFTVLHAAVVANLRTLVVAMLEFCQAHNVDVLQTEVLGMGDSIYHLMVRLSLAEMIPLVQRYVPLDLQRTNYQGQTVCDVADLSTEMSRVLNIQ